MSYNYYILGDDGVAHSVVSFPEEVNLTENPEFIVADDYDASVLGSRRVGTSWVAPPSPYHRWSILKDNWTVPGIDQVNTDIEAGVLTADEGADIISRLQSAISEYQAQNSGD